MDIDPDTLTALVSHIATETNWGLRDEITCDTHEWEKDVRDAIRTFQAPVPVPPIDMESALFRAQANRVIN